MSINSMFVSQFRSMPEAVDQMTLKRYNLTYGLMVNKNQWDLAHNISEWCFDAFGSAGLVLNSDTIRYVSIDRNNWYSIWFSNSDDFVFFKLTWSNHIEYEIVQGKTKKVNHEQH